jgi:hypothetical protein
MPTTLRLSLNAIFVGICLSICLPAVAQEPDTAPPADDDVSPSWYDNSNREREPEYKPNPRAIIHERAFARASQRNARLSSLAWYGMFNGRPIASPTPFTSIYSPGWQQPGGRPFAWHAGSRPTYVFYR